MNIHSYFKSLYVFILLAFISFTNIYAGEYDTTLTAYLGTTPILDGFISEGEYSDAEFVTGVNGWFSGTDNGTACADSLDLSVKVWYKHDGTHLFFAFDVTDDIMYGFDTERWLPDVKPEANELERGAGWPYWGDGLEIMMNPSYTWDETKKSIGDGTIWQTICNTHKSYAGGLTHGGLIEGIPYTEYAWNNYRDWYTNEYMKATVRIKTPEEGSGYIVEWRISPNPCMQIDSENFVDLSKENKVGINFEFEDIDNADDGLGTNNLAQFRHVDYMAVVEPYRKNIAKSFATLQLSPYRMNPDTPTLPKSENYENSLNIPASYSVYLETGNTIEVQTSGDCGNNKLMINDASSSGSGQVVIPFSEIDQTVYATFDITPEQINSNIHLDLMSDRESVVKISFEDDKITYYQNGSSTAWKSYTKNTKYRVQIVADNQSKKYSLEVNGEIIQDLNFHNSSGAAINEFRIYSLTTSVGNYEFDNLIIQDGPIETSDLYNFDDCWELSYDYEESTDVPSSHIVIADNPTDVSVDYSSICDNNSLQLIDNSSSTSSMVKVPFDNIDDMVHVQFTVEANQNDQTIDFDLGKADSIAIKVALTSDGKFRYYQNGSFIDWNTYNSNTKYSIQIIANNLSKEYDFIVDADTVKSISFFNSTVTSIDNMTIMSPSSSEADVRVDNMVVSNHVLSELVYPFNACVEFTGQATPDVLNKRVNIYPNPSNGFITIELGSAHPNPIILTDLMGREIYRVKNTMGTQFEMNLTNIEAGLYLINFDNELGRFSQQIQLIK